MEAAQHRERERGAEAHRRGPSSGPAAHRLCAVSKFLPLSLPQSPHWQKGNDNGRYED